MDAPERVEKAHEQVLHREVGRCEDRDALVDDGIDVDGLLREHVDRRALPEGGHAFEKVEGRRRDREEVPRDEMWAGRGRKDQERGARPIPNHMKFGGDPCGDQVVRERALRQAR